MHLVDFEFRDEFNRGFKFNRRTIIQILPDYQVLVENIEFKLNIVVLFAVNNNETGVKPVFIQESMAPTECRPTPNMGLGVIMPPPPG